MKKELLANFKYDDKGNLLEIPTVDQLEGLLYVQAAIKEIHRTSAIIPAIVATSSKVNLKKN
jgi:hypothetical protein